MTRIVITGTSAICGAGRTPTEVLAAVRAGRSAIGPIGQWDASRWPVRSAAEVGDFNASALLNDRKLFKLIRRTDVFGIYAAGQAIDAAGLARHRDALDAEAATRFSDATGVYVGSGGGSYDNQYDYLPLIAAADGSLPAFGRDLGATVNPMWLLRSLPNNVLCHVGIRHGLKGSNACITNHSISGALAVMEAAEALRSGECERAVAVGHDAPIEPQTLLYYHSVGLVTEGALRPFDAGRSGTAMGEGAGALVLETAQSAAARGAAVLGEILGGGSASEGEGLLPIRDDGDGLARAIAIAIDGAGLRAGDVGMVVAHGNGTRAGDASEARALQAVFGAAPPPVTAFKWALGHLLAASGIVELVVGLAALRERTVPGIAALQRVDPACAALPVSRSAQTPRSDVALVLSRGFGGTNAALVVRAAAA
jgi:3-oxoacyl-[acyl-carrier-protein] synthase-1